MDDLISRQAAIEALDGEVVVTGKTNAKAVKEYIQEVSDKLKAIPSAEVEPVKRGRWIEDNDPNADLFFRKGWKCSVCGSRTSYGTPPYCMRCGAKMEPISASPENGKEQKFNAYPTHT